MITYTQQVMSSTIKHVIAVVPKLSQLPGSGVFS